MASHIVSDLFDVTPINIVDESCKQQGVASSGNATIAAAMIGKSKRLSGFDEE